MNYNYYIEKHTVRILSLLSLLTGCTFDESLQLFGNVFDDGGTVSWKLLFFLWKDYATNLMIFLFLKTHQH